MATATLETPNTELTSDIVRERISRYLDDAIALEASSITGLKDMIDDATDPQDAILFREHLTQTESQKIRLEARLAELGGKPNELKGVLNKIGVAATGLLHVGKDAHDKAARNMIEAFAIENTEAATYESLYAAANAVGDTETAQLAKEIQAEEETAAKKVFARIAPLAAEAIRIGTAEGRH